MSEPSSFFTGKHNVVLNLYVDSPGPLQRDKTPNSHSSDEENVFIRRCSRSSSTTSTKKTYKHYVETSELIYYDNQVADLRCEVRRDSDSIIWLKDDRKLFSPSSGQLIDGEKYESVNDGRYRALIIKDLGRADSGNYVCQSKRNPNSKIEFRMSVNEPKAEIVQPLADIKVSS